MAMAPKTPARGCNSGSHATVDLVTGKAKVEYFFDPTLALPPDGDSFETPAKKPSLSAPRTPVTGRKGSGSGEVDDAVLFTSRHLFMPCTVVKEIGSEDSDDDDGADPSGEIPALVKTSDGQLHRIRDRNKLVPLTAPEDYAGIPDVLHLPNVTEASLLHALRVRYNRDEIYTSAGPILMSVNPYKAITLPGGEDLYSEERMLLYRNSTTGFPASSAGNPNALPCHLFQVADRAYGSLLSSVMSNDIEPHMEEEDALVMMEKDHEQKRRNHVVRNQSIIISGESGAGKTEATKKIMQYLARVTKEKGTVGEKVGAKSQAGMGAGARASLEDRVLSSNPLLESFGNARTLKNDNSSRFGKFIKITLNTETGSIVGASVSNYLLEKTRITAQIEGERNYHIFYQIFSAADEGLLTKLRLGDGIAAFRYLGNRATLKSRRDAGAFLETMACLNQIGLSEDEQNGVLGIVAAVLHIGNIDFEVAKAEDSHSAGEKAQITETSTNSLKSACSLLGLDKAKVSEAMLTKLLSVGGKTIHKPQDVAQASDKRDALAKLTYSSLFLWLVNKINTTLASEDALPKLPASAGEMFSPLRAPYQPLSPTGFIGVLDIYGFENFENNGFEQLLINYANEKLQRHFNRHLFEVEQSLYSSEGVDWTYITFNDNRPCLELIEGGGGSVGILSTLDDCGGMGTSAERDVNFLAQLHQKFGGGLAGATGANGGTKNKKKKNKSKEPERHKNFITPKFAKDRDFIVVHYAGEVRYTVKGFVEKNVETLSNELKDLGSSSTLTLTNAIFDTSAPCADSTTTSRRSTIRGVSVASQFRTSLQMLVMDLECTQPHYVRCIKPNTKKAFSLFDSGEVLRQLRYSGMMETIRIRREGYALREEHESFHRRFHLLLSTDEARTGDGISHLVKVLSKRLNLTDAEWQIGHTKIFLKRDLAGRLEMLAHMRVRAAARVVSKFGRKIARARASRLLSAWGSFRLIMLRKYRMIAAASKISSTYQMHRARKTYKTFLQAAVTVQCLCRRILARELVQLKRDPYLNMSYKELDILHENEVVRMENAVIAKEFQTAADIEKKLVLLKEALESKRPLTRSVLESRISEVQALVDDAVSRKAFTECTPLQKQLEDLVQKRADLPTIDELKEAVCLAEKDVANAAARRDFSGAAAAQTALDKANEKLEDTLRSEGTDVKSVDSKGDDAVVESRFKSRTELEVAIAEATKRIDDAIAKKAFKEATSRQAKLEELESLRPTLPSLEELEAELNGLKQQMDKAIEKKDFKKADILQKDIDQLEAKLKEEKVATSSTTEITTSKNPLLFTNEKGEEVVFVSRSEIEEEISRFQCLVEKSIALKKFKEASKHQDSLDHLEKMKLSLPTADELENELTKAKKEIDSAIQNKDFEKAQHMHLSVQEIEKKLELEQKSIIQPTIAAVGTGLPQAPVVSAIPVVAKVSDKVPLPDRSNARNIVLPSIISPSATTEPKKPLMTLTSGKSVSKLRPRVPIISQTNCSVLEVAQLLASKRGDAAIITDRKGGLAGIITDTDITRRVVAKRLSSNFISVSDVMTTNPSCVSMSDKATDALVKMVENRFRHLPVTDDNGSVVGVLDIAKCLNDAISKLERSQENGSDAAEEALKASLGGAHGAQAAALQQLLGPLLSTALSGQSSPTLRAVLAGKPSTIVTPGTTIQDTGDKMAEARKAALVVDKGQLVGIFGFKDMMTRAVAKELPLDYTAVSTVMTPSPESVSPSTTVLEALQIMHDNKFLTLPVCESNGTVVGIVDVMDCVYASGGADGWKSIFSTAMEYDDVSRTCSHVSASVKSTKVSCRKDEKPVSKLRPKKPILAYSSDSVLSVSQTLSSKRADAALLVDANGGLAGIITDTDVTRRVVAKQLPPESTNVSSVMTANPFCVSMTDSALEALVTMVQNRFRHLPVTDINGGVVGCLDIAKCLNDAITKLERANEKSCYAAEDAMKQVDHLQNADGGNQTAALQALLGPLLVQALGSKTLPTLRSVLKGKPSTIVSPNSTLQTVGLMMAESHKAALIVENNVLVGIFGFKDMMTRAVAKELPLDSTPVSNVMTANPEVVSPESSVLEALQIMHDNKFLTLPVCEDDGQVLGLVDVMDCVCASGGVQGWKSLFDSALDQDDVSSVYSADDASQKRPPVLVKSHPNNIPLHVRVDVGNILSGDQDSICESLTHHNQISTVGSPKLIHSEAMDDAVVYKIFDGKGHTFVIRAGKTIDSIARALEGKVTNLDLSTTVFKYFDDEGDEILIKSDECVEEAVRSSTQAGNKNVKISMNTSSDTFDNKTILLAGGAGVVAAIAIVMVVLLKAKK